MLQRICSPHDIDLNREGFEKAMRSVHTDTEEDNEEFRRLVSDVAERFEIKIKTNL